MTTMHSQLSALLLAGNTPNVACILAGLVAAVVVVSKLSKNHKLDAIPTVGWAIWPGPWLASGTKVMQEGYSKYKNAPFKIADRFNWVVVLSSREHLEEVRKAPEDVLSFHEATGDDVKTKYTMPREMHHNRYHHEVIHSHLNRNLVSLYDDIQDEVVAAFDEVLNLKNNEWKSVPALKAIQQVVCRASNRVFVGLPLCRDPDWLDLNLRYTLDVVYGAFILKVFPDFLGNFVVKYMSNIPRSTNRGMKLLGPVIEERLRLMENHGEDWGGKSNDGLSWLLDVAPVPNRTVQFLTPRMLSFNMAAIHTSSISFTHALFYLVGHPQYNELLREEVESVVNKEGWTKTSLGNMHKMDSFLKECQRLAGVGTISLMRKVMKDFTFSDGTVIPEGTLIVAPSREFHLDNEVYPDAQEFDPLRFSNMRGEDGEGAKYQFVSTSLEYLAFGHGKHACPGRFFAATEFKMMLAHIVMSYDIKLEDDKTQPKEILFGVSVVPDGAAKVMFKKRVRRDCSAAGINHD